jgi:23S rRNA (uracil1939-C5)-methyltransferase
MAVSTGQELELIVGKPAAGGYTIARHDGEVLLVRGAIPGERVRVRVTRADKRVAFAEAAEILDPSPDRRRPQSDPTCGGCLYAFIDYPRQLELKGQIVQDAFTRIGRIPLDAPIEVAASPERAYRMRARFHVRGRAIGFYREGTHDLCDARSTGQVSDSSIEAVEAAVASLAVQRIAVTSVELSENIAADARALHFDIGSGKVSADAFERAVSAAGVSGCTARTVDEGFHAAGEPLVSDPLDVLSQGRAGNGTLSRHPEAFFQANRFLLPSLVTAVMEAVPAGSVFDLYAGVGLFAVPLAASGNHTVTAVEGDPVSGRDLRHNAAPFSEKLRVVRSSVEAFLARGGRTAPDTVIVDPPRTGMSREAADGIVALRPPRIVYVSCDPATMARDARRLLDAGYELRSLKGFDLFPNTPHVETLGVFTRREEQASA